MDITNVFDKAKKEIKEMVDLTRYIERFDCEIMKPGGANPTDIALEKRRRYERRYVVLLKRYT